MKRTPLTADPDKVRDWQRRSRQGANPRRRPISPASKGQREAILGRPCLVTGSTEAVTPAHVIDRSIGGCDSSLCVVPLRVDVHRAYDDHELDLLPYLEGHHLRDELAHAVTHLGLLGALERITGVHWAPLDDPPRLAA